MTELTPGKKDYFGFLPKNVHLRFHDFEISPVKDFDRLLEWFESSTHYQDHFYYPPNSYTEHQNIQSGEIERVPQSERLAMLHPLPSSHEIINLGNGGQANSKNEIVCFVVNAIAYLLGIRLQFHDWWVDMRVPGRSQNHVYVTQHAAEEFMNAAVDKWKSLDAYHQKLLNNLMFMHSRNPSYYWDWERFMMEYATFDGCWKFDGAKDCPHKDRLKYLLGKHGIKTFEKELDFLVALRNDLFHETLWDKGQPCTAGSQESFYSYYHLHRINHRLIASLVGYHTEYIRSDWRNIGMYMFNEKSKGSIINDFGRKHRIQKQTL